MEQNNKQAVRTWPFFLLGLVFVLLSGLYGAIAALDAAAHFKDNLLFVLYELLFPEEQSHVSRVCLFRDGARRALSRSDAGAFGAG